MCCDDVWSCDDVFDLDGDVLCCDVGVWSCDDVPDGDELSCGDERVPDGELSCGVVPDCDDESCVCGLSFYDVQEPCDEWSCDDEWSCAFVRGLCDE
jgi:hypothetical protein